MDRLSSQMPLQKPERKKRKTGDGKKLDHQISDEELANIAQQARYAGSAYHRPPGSPMGLAATRKWPTPSKCDPKWDQEKANRALKAAILERFVSLQKKQGFPRLVWYKDGDVLYEARLSNEGQGDYHAYPLDSRWEWPGELR